MNHLLKAGFSHLYEVVLTIRDQSGLEEIPDPMRSLDSLVPLDEAAALAAAALLTKRLLETYPSTLRNFARFACVADVDIPDRVYARVRLPDQWMGVRTRIVSPVLWTLCRGAAQVEENSGGVPLYALKSKALDVLHKALRPAGVKAPVPAIHWHGLSAVWDGGWAEIAGSDGYDHGHLVIRAKYLT